ncbi:4-phosphoerythronate dehydrogenase [bacterium]|nr:4-phosphoerythronate dehydrogenase [bacterium]
MAIAIAADSNIPFISEACDGIGDVRLYDVRDEVETRECVASAEVLLCRSTLRIDEQLLEDTQVRFVATATSGTDHLDLAWLEAQGIPWASAGGSNARSVAEWLAAVLLELHVRERTDLVAADIGIVGVGHVGSQVADIARALGLRMVLNDPPRSARGEKPLPWSDIRFSPLDELLHCAILTLHTPLTSADPFPTRQLIGERRLSMLPPSATVINAARGEVLDPEAVPRWRRWEGGALVLDVYPGEPGIDPALVDVADIATPHVAGHSLDGKLLGTQMVHDALCDWLDIEHPWNFEQYLPESGAIVPAAGTKAVSPFAEVHEVVRQVVPIQRDDASLRAIMQKVHKERGVAFKSLRAEYPVRREFRRIPLERSQFSGEAVLMLEALGFQLM